MMTVSSPLRIFAEELPEGWQILPFEAMLSEPVRNGIYKSRGFHGRGTRVVNMGEIFGFDFISGQEMKRVELTEVEERKSGLKDGDLLFARRSLVLEGAGKCSLVVNPPEALTFESSIIRARPNREIADPRFLFYLFTSPLGRAIVASIATRTAVSGIRGSDLRQVGLPLPALPEQRRIAGILSTYDELIENSQRRIRILESMARTLYREWFVHFRFPGHEIHHRVASPLGDIPKGWDVGRLDDVLVLQRGFDLPRAVRVEGDVPIYAATGITGFHNEAKVEAPGVVTGRSGTIGDVLYVQEDFWPLNTTLWVKEFPKSEPLYGYFVLSSFDLKQFNSGAAVPTLNRNDIHGLDTLIPPRELQMKFQRMAGDMLRQVRALELKIQNLRRTRDLLLPRLLSGQLTLDAEAA